MALCHCLSGIHNHTNKHNTCSARDRATFGVQHNRGLGAAALAPRQAPPGTRHTQQQSQGGGGGSACLHSIQCSKHAHAGVGPEHHPARRARLRSHQEVGRDVGVAPWRGVNPLADAAMRPRARARCGCAAGAGAPRRRPHTGIHNTGAAGRAACSRGLQCVCVCPSVCVCVRVCLKVDLGAR